MSYATASTAHQWHRMLVVVGLCLAGMLLVGCADGDFTHKSIFETAPPAPTTQGSLHELMPEGTGVDGGMRKRVKGWK